MGDRYLEFYIYDDSSDLTGKITVTEQSDDGTLRFDTELFDSDLSNGQIIGDLRAIFFDLGFDVDSVDLTASGSDLTNSQFAEADVSNLGQGLNINGQVVNQFGQPKSCNSDQRMPATSARR